MRLKKIVRLLTVLLVFPFALTAQVTTGIISGSVKDAKGTDLTGATIEVLHEPSGSVYRSTSGKSGTFNIPSLRIGGPYKVTIKLCRF
jgi:Carboxypeptidase regulatory-like domain